MYDNIFFGDGITSFESAIHSSGLQFSALNEVSNLTNTLFCFSVEIEEVVMPFLQALQVFDSKHSQKLTKTLSEDIRRKCGCISWLELSSKLALLISEQAGSADSKYSQSQWEEVKNRSLVLTGRLREVQRKLPSDNKMFKNAFCALLHIYAFLHGILWDPACCRCCMAAEWWILGLSYSGSSRHNLNRVLLHMQLLLLYLSSEALNPSAVPDPCSPSPGSLSRPEFVDAQYCLSLSAVVATTMFDIADGPEYPGQARPSQNKVAISQQTSPSDAPTPKHSEVAIKTTNDEHQFSLSLTSGPVKLEFQDKETVSLNGEQELIVSVTSGPLKLEIQESKTETILVLPHSQPGSQSEIVMGGETVIVTLPDTPTSEIVSTDDAGSILDIPDLPVATKSDADVSENRAFALTSSSIPLAIFPMGFEGQSLAIIPYAEKKFCLAILPATSDVISEGKKPCLAIMPHEDTKHCFGVLPDLHENTFVSESTQSLAIIPYQSQNKCIAVFPNIEDLTLAGESNTLEQNKMSLNRTYILQGLQHQNVYDIKPDHDMVCLAQNTLCLTATSSEESASTTANQSLEIIPYDEKMHCLAIIPTKPDLPLREQTHCLAIVPYDEKMHCLAIIPAKSNKPDQPKFLAVVPAISDITICENKSLLTIRPITPDTALLEPKKCLAIIPYKLNNMSEQQCLIVVPTTVDAAVEGESKCIALIPDFSIAEGGLELINTTSDVALEDGTQCIAVIPTAPRPLDTGSQCIAVIPTAPGTPEEQRSILAIVPRAGEVMRDRQKLTSAEVTGQVKQEASQGLITILNNKEKEILLSITGDEANEGSSQIAETMEDVIAVQHKEEKQQSLVIESHREENCQPCTEPEKKPVESVREGVGSSYSASHFVAQPEIMELVKVGLKERAMRMLEFIHQAGVIAIAVIGENGLGKTSILREVISTLAVKEDYAVAFGEVGTFSSNECLTEFLSMMTHQLGGDGREVFRSLCEGREALKKQLHLLKMQKKRVCVALDSVLSGTTLQKLIPECFSSILPHGSCILVTSPSDSIPEMLDNLCRVPEESDNPVKYLFWAYTPTYMLPSEAKEMLMCHASVRGVQLLPEHEELVDNLIPLCGGLPLVLQIIGSYFARFSRRKREEWWTIANRMLIAEEYPVRGDEICSKLKVVVDGLEDSLQETFLDIVVFFKGFDWKKAERSLGKHHMASLADQALICMRTKEMYSHSCTHGHPERVPTCRQSTRLSTGVVEVHDLVSSVGVQIAQESYVVSVGEDKLPARLLERANLASVQALALKKCGEPFPLNMLDKMKKLHFLLIEGTHLVGHCHRTPHNLRYLVWHPSDQGKERASMPFKLKKMNKLSVAHLHNIQSDFSDIEFPPRLTELELHNCVKMVELPKSFGLLKLLQSLHLHNCHSLRALPESISSLAKLQELVLSVCTNLMELPQTIGNLHALEYIDLAACFKLTGLPKSIGDLKSLKVLDLTGCESLIDLPAELGNLCKLQELVLAGCGSLRELPPKIGSLTDLRTLDLSHCEQLTSLPIQIGNLVSLKEMNLMWCEKLSALPPQIGFLHSLQNLELSDCRNLPEVPVTIGIMKSLQQVHLRGCTNLHFVPPEIGNLLKLTSLDMRGCINLLSLPLEVAALYNLSYLGLECLSASHLWPHLDKLTLLRKLDIDDKTGICTTVPIEIWSLSCLEKLALRGFKNVDHLGNSEWKLSALTSLWLEGFASLKSLPPGISHLKSLKLLVLAEFESLIEFPAGIEKLENLERLSLRCKSVRTLPANLFSGLKILRSLSLVECTALTELSVEKGSLPLLETFDVVSCKSLKKLPPELGSMAALQHLNCRECTSLSTLPMEIGQLQNLQSICLHQCSSLSGLPMEIGSLSALVRLDLRKCTNLTDLPLTIGRMSRLKYLQLCGNVKLKKLPTEIEHLENLIELNLEGCTALTVLPSEIGRLSKLENLGLDSCIGLVYLPPEIGRLQSLKRLSLARCSNLQLLPAEIGTLLKLKLLRLDGCINLIQLPPQLGSLENLLNLGLEDCRALMALPQEICALQNLELLDLRGCLFSDDDVQHHMTQQGCTVVRNDLEWEGFEEVWLYY